MLIDWFTVGAQIVNFIILIYLLKRFLYKPILRAMDKREQKISSRLQQAEESRKKAESDAEAAARELRKIEGNKQKMEEEVREEIKKWREQALEKAKEEVDKSRNSWLENLEQEKRDFIRRVKATLSHQVFSVAAKTIHDLADDQLESKIIARFTNKLSEAFSTKEDSKRTGGERLQVKSGFEISSEQQEEIQSVVSRIFPDSELEFNVNREIGYGVLFLAGNTKFEWNVQRYMDEMEQQILNAMHLTRRDSE